LGWPLAPDPEGWYEVRLPAGRIDLRAQERSPGAGYRPSRVEGFVLQSPGPSRVEVAMVRGRSVELHLAPGETPLPEGHMVFLIEAEYWDAVRYVPERNSWDAGPLSETLFQRLVGLGEQGSTVRGLDPGRYRFKVFPDDVALEPAEVVVGEGTNGPVLV